MTFDALAQDYDVDFSDRPTARTLRGLVHDRLRAHLSPGAAVLELGCGTGIDAAFMAGLGAQVTATDPSAGMLHVAARRAIEGVRFAALDVNALPSDGFGGAYRLVLANFGALNGCGDFSVLAAWLSDRVAQGGVVCMAIMSRFCLWETAWNLLRLKPQRAARRWRGSATFAPLGGAPMTVLYPSISEVMRAFAPYFAPARPRGLGVALPPSEMFGVVERRPWLSRRLTGWEKALWSRGWGAPLADHVWFEMVKR
ncbi:MAG: class I SAM-dependent methyltransferase [Anaerolineae bacterium]|jgi:SAM-dependent methyltransferase|nr:class I SAM-dependent methyltransferase [Anaerolineae bacterium]